MPGLCTRKSQQEVFQRNNIHNWTLRVEIAKGLIANYSSCKRTSSPFGFLALLPGENEGRHVNAHMGAEYVKTCVVHTTFIPQGVKCKRIAFGCELCNVHLCKECHFPWHQKHNIDTLP